MFTRAKIYNGGTYLKNHLRANDYYSKGERVTGTRVEYAQTIQLQPEARAGKPSRAGAGINLENIL